MGERPEDRRAALQAELDRRRSELGTLRYETSVLEQHRDRLQDAVAGGQLRQLTARIDGQDASSRDATDDSRSSDAADSIRRDSRAIEMTADELLFKLGQLARAENEVEAAEAALAALDDVRGAIDRAGAQGERGDQSSEPVEERDDVRADGGPFAPEQGSDPRRPEIERQTEAPMQVSGPETGSDPQPATIEGQAEAPMPMPGPETTQPMSERLDGGTAIPEPTTADWPAPEPAPTPTPARATAPALAPALVLPLAPAPGPAPTSAPQPNVQLAAQPERANILALADRQRQELRAFVAAERLRQGQPTLPGESPYPMGAAQASSAGPVQNAPPGPEDRERTDSGRSEYESAVERLQREFDRHDQQWRDCPATGENIAVKQQAMQELRSGARAEAVDSICRMQATREVQAGNEALVQQYAQKNPAGVADYREVLASMAESDVSQRAGELRQQDFPDIPPPGQETSVDTREIDGRER